MKIDIIGAGPAGSYVGYLLAQDGHDVDIYEEHPSIGIPFQCTGILTSELDKFVKITEDFYVNTIEKARIQVNDAFVDIDMHRPNTIIERTKFDQHVAELAKKAGARVHLQHRFIENNGKELTIKDVKNDRMIKKKTDILIGADGPNSTVAKCNGMYGDRKFWIGIQARAEYPNQNVVEMLPKVGTFGWIVPEDDKIVRIGLVGDKHTKQDFDQLLKERGITKILGHQGGLIPKYDPSVVTEKGHVYLIGDAALQVKATTAGGIVQALIAGQALRDSIKYGKSYEKEWRKRLGRDLWLHKYMRDVLDKFKDADYEYIINLFNRPKIRRYLEAFDREYPSKFMLQLFFSEPRLLKFIKYLF